MDSAGSRYIAVACYIKHSNGFLIDFQVPNLEVLNIH